VPLPKKRPRTRSAFLRRLVATFCLIGSAAPISAAETGEPHPRVAQFADYWVGSFSNERQVRLHEDRLVPDYPELVRLPRDLRVHRLEGSPLGDLVLFLEEIKMDEPTLAHRQRVMTFAWRAESQEVEVNQLFFKEGPTYDRTLLDPEKVAAMTKDTFRLEANCNLFFTWDEALQRFKGGMRPQACKYDHETSGPVYAEFDMILDRHRLMYRDRSIIRADGSIRGEIDGFSWLRFDRLADVPVLANGDLISRDELMRRMPASGSMEGTWEGRFIRVGPDGEILESFPTRIIATYLPDGEAFDFQQVNIYRPGTPEETRIESFGKWDVDRLHFFNERLEGWSKDVDLDESGLTSVFYMSYLDGSGLKVSEVISRSPDDPNKRMRATQYMKDGKILRRTLIDETRVEGPKAATE